MKLKPSLPLVCAVLVLPFASAIRGMELISGTIFAVAVIVCCLSVMMLCIHPTFSDKKYPGVNTLKHGCVLIKTCDACAVFHTVLFVLLKTFLKMKFLPVLGFIIWAYTLILVMVIFAGVRLLLGSRQMTLLQRVLLILTFWIPAVNFFVLKSAYKTAYLEYDFETNRIELNNARAENEICKTKYPILLVHGIFFRDSNFFNYWGRVPAELIRNGAEVFYGDQRSAASVEDCAEELRAKIESITSLTSCGKVNVIAHSKGGLDIRRAANLPGMEGKIASITTINTPHRGCRYAEVLLESIPKPVLNYIADKYNGALKRFGESGSDFIKGVTDLTKSRCLEFNQNNPTPEGIYCQSFGSYMKKPSSAGFPLNFAYILVKLFSTSPNDGLVDVDSMKWGESFTLFEPKTKRGISHGDMIDLFRENISQFDVRESYVGIVAGLKERGL